MAVANMPKSQTNQIVPLKQYLKIVLIVSLWIHISETFRYFVFIMPELKESLAVIPNVAPMDLFVFSIWGLWDTVLTAILVFIYQLALNFYGDERKSILMTSLVMWAFFWILWVGIINMGIIGTTVLYSAIPLSALEMIVGSWIASRFIKLPKKL